MRREDWLKLSIVAAAFAALYAPVAAKLGRDWWHDPNYSQGFLIPPLAAYLVWEKREALAKIGPRPSNLGLPLVICAAALLFLGSLGAELFLTRVSLVCMLAAIVVFIFGWEWLRELRFPLAVLLLMIPIPEIIYNEVALPLQLAATRFAGMLLGAAGVPVYLEGNLIQLPHDVTLEIAEACSGIRSLMALLALGVAYGHFFAPRRSIRWLLIAATFPIAIAANATRIAGTGVLTYTIGQQAAEGYFHIFSGWLVFVLAFLLLVALHRLFSMFARTPSLREAQ